jgi:hypothetical protein
MPAPLESDFLSRSLGMKITASSLQTPGQRRGGPEAIFYRIRPRRNMKAAFTLFLLLQTLLICPSRGAPIITPPDLEPGTPYRLIFVTAGTRNATSSDISDYNTFVTQQAGDLVPSAQWFALASTLTVSARENTGTDSPGGVPIYNLNGQRVANDYADLWDGSLINAPRYDQNGETADSMFVWTGSTTDGYAFTTTARYLGASTVLAGSATLNGTGWLQAGSNSNTDEMRVYGISSVIPEPSSVLLLLVGGLGAWVHPRKSKI